MEHDAKARAEERREREWRERKNANAHLNTERRRLARARIGELAAELDGLALKLSGDEMSAVMDCARTLHLIEHGYVLRLVNVDTGEAR